MRVKKNDGTWRKEWKRQIADIVELSSDDEPGPGPSTPIKEELITQFKQEYNIEIKEEPNMDSEVSESINPMQYGETFMDVGVNELNTSFRTADPVENFSFLNSPSHVSTTTVPIMTMFGMSTDDPAQKVAEIKAHPGLSLDEKLKIFYGLNCYLCPNLDTFNILGDLENHFKIIHPGKKPKFSCCGYDNITKKAIMEKHMKCHLKEFKKLTPSDHINQLKNSHWCTKCETPFNKQEQLEKHNLRIHQNVKAKERERKLKSELNKLKNMNFGNTIRCSYCNELLSTFKQIEEHKTKHIIIEGIPPCDIKCYLCQKTFASQTSLDKHKTTHLSEPSTSAASSTSNDSIQKCPYCSFYSKKKSDFIKHVTSHLSN